MTKLNEDTNNLPVAAKSRDMLYAPLMGIAEDGIFKREAAEQNDKTKKTLGNSFINVLKEKSKK